MSLDGPLDVLLLSKGGRRTRKLKAECNKRLSRYREADDGEVYLDSRCANPKCRWINADGSRGCTDEAALQFDHIAGQGSMERKSGLMGDRLYFAIMRNSGAFQLLCANCNEIKSKGEKLGARLHKTRLLISR